MTQSTLLIYTKTMDEYQEYIRLFGDLPFGMRPKFEDYQKQKSAQTARNVLSSELQKGNLEKAYTEGYEQLPLMDQLLYGVAPGTGEALATYEIPEFAKRGNIAAQEGRKLDAAGNYLVSGLNAMSMIPVVGKAAGLAGDVTRILGRGTRAKTSDDMGGGTPPTPPPPTSTPTAFETVLTAEDIRGINKYTSRPATTVLEESVVNNPKFKKLYPNPDKPYEIDNMLTLMGKYGGDNRNVKEQIDLYVSPELKAKGKVTTRELLNDIADNKPRFTEYKARYEEGPEKYDQVDQTREMDYLYNSPFVARYDNPTTITEAQQRKAPIDYEHKSFYINPTKEGQTYNITNPVHPEVSQGFMDSRTPTRNKVFHSRQYTYNIDGKIVSIPAEGQSGAYKMFEKAEDVPFSFDETLDAGTRATLDDINNTIEEPLIESLRMSDTIPPEYNNVQSIYELITLRNLRLGRMQVPDFKKLKSENSERVSNITDEEIDSELLDTLNMNFDILSEEQGLPPRVLTEANITPKMRTAYKSHLENSNELSISTLENTFNEGFTSIDTLNNFRIKKQELAEKLQQVFNRELGLIVENYDPKKLPLFNEWFNVHMKTSLQDAANSGVDEVWFPINDYAVARQRGETLSTPQAVRIAEFESDGELMPIDFKAKMQPSKGATEMAKKYKKFTEKGLNAIERDYGVKLNAEPFTDANNQEFYKIELTNELKDALSTLKLNRGGLATLMPLHYT